MGTDEGSLLRAFIKDIFSVLENTKLTKEQMLANIEEHRLAFNTVIRLYGIEDIDHDTSI